VLFFSPSAWSIRIRFPSRDLLSWAILFSFPRRPVTFSDVLAERYAPTVEHFFFKVKLLAK
jgi:hypothetical protein